MILPVQLTTVSNLIKMCTFSCAFPI